MPDQPVLYVGILSGELLRDRLVVALEHQRGTVGRPGEGSCQDQFPAVVRRPGQREVASR